MSPFTEPDVKIPTSGSSEEPLHPFPNGYKYNIVTILNLYLSTEDVSLSQWFNCQSLSSTGITLLYQYYELI